MLNKLKNQLGDLGLDSMLVTSSKNIFYLTGYQGFSNEEREAVILITKKNNYLLTDKRYLNELKYLNNFKLEEISAANPLSKIIAKLAKDNNLQATGFEENNFTVSEYKKIKENLKSFKPAEVLIENLREIKTKEEIKKIKQACKLSDLGFKFILSHIKENVTEQELAEKLEIYLKGKHADISFKPIIAFGKNSAIPHHLNSKIKLKKGNIVLIDIGAKMQGYCSDMTRTVFFGSPTPKFKHIYQTVLNAQKKSAEFINLKSSVGNQKVYASDADSIAREYIVQKGFETIPHSLGHGIGMDVHEKPSLSPKSKSVLKNGMIFSIEPGIYLEGYGGIRIEDLYLLTDKRLVKITHSTSKIISL